jgi:hypothetical protein
MTGIAYREPRREAAPEINEQRFFPLPCTEIVHLLGDVFIGVCAALTQALDRQGGLCNDDQADFGSGTFEA